MSDRTGAAADPRRPRQVQTEGPTAAADLDMLIATGGRRRSAPDERDLLATARFELTRIVPTTSDLHVLEAYVV
jgi:hypothetical protein